MSDSRIDPVTPYDRLAWTDEQIETLLLAGERRRELIAVFGASLYLELAGLARAAHSAHAAAGRRVWLVPGIMGSRLGKLRTAGEPPDTLWLDPLDIVSGRIGELKLADNSQIRSLGILHFSYLKLKLELAAAGFAVRSFDYDWRRGVIELGALFAAAMRADARDCMIVAHSMGGLVARCAMTQPALPAVSRLVMLGTPNGGSWATVQALRGTYLVVQRLAQLDLQNDAETLARAVFSSFQGLYDLLPGAPSSDHTLLSTAAWPRTGLQPDAARLHSASAVGSQLIPGDARCACIVGFGQRTVVGGVAAQDFSYSISSAGDGTVPALAAQLAGSACYFTRTSHSHLTREPAIAAAVTDLLRSGTTSRLPVSLPASSRFDGVTDTQLRAMPQPKLDWARMSIDERRLFLDALNEPSAPVT